MTLSLFLIRHGETLWNVEGRIQGSTDTADLGRFAEELDRRLCERNEDYSAHRAEGFGLNPPRIIVGSPGAFAAWMKSRGKLGGQNKVPRVITNQELLENLKNFVESYR